MTRRADLLAVDEYRLVPPPGLTRDPDDVTTTNIAAPCRCLRITQNRQPIGRDDDPSRRLTRRGRISRRLRLPPEPVDIARPNMRCRAVERASCNLAVKK
jgi:hypothetical protein